MPDNMTTAGGGQNSEETPRSGMGFPAENPDGSPSVVGPDEYTRWWRQQQANRPAGQTVLAGNIADLHRLAEVVTAGKSVEQALTDAPRGVSPRDDEIKTGPQLEAEAGLWNRETERLGLLDAPPPPEPPSRPDDVNIVHPDSRGPVVESSTSTSTTPSSTPPKPKEK